MGWVYRKRETDVFGVTQRKMDVFGQFVLEATKNIGGEYHFAFYFNLLTYDSSDSY